MPVSDSLTLEERRALNQHRQAIILQFINERLQDDALAALGWVRQPDADNDLKLYPDLVYQDWVRGDSTLVIEYTLNGFQLRIIRCENGVMQSVDDAQHVLAQYNMGPLTDQALRDRLAHVAKQLE
jgi:hypothetical protein